MAIGLPPAVLAAGHPSPADSPPEDGKWWQQARTEIRDAEYRITWQDRTYVEGLEAAWHAPNRAHDFRIYFADEGIRVIRRTEVEPTWEWGLSLTGYGRGDLVVPVKPALVSADANRVEYARGAIVEWYVNGPDGLEQGFTLESPPGNGEGTKAFLEMQLLGDLSAVLSPDSKAIDFVDTSGAPIVHYSKLVVRDATGTELPSWMEGFANTGIRGIRLVFDIRDAVYPVTVDPLATSPAWTADGEQAGAEFGNSVATAGDVNGDGYSDVIVGAHLYDNGQSDEGRVFVYHGHPSGLSPAADWTAEGDQAGAEFGTSVATAGDVNGDGYSDVIVGAYLWDSSVSATDAGKAYVYHGSTTGLAGTPAWTAEESQAEAGLGYSVATAGDVNGDGYSDVIVGVPGWDDDSIIMPDRGLALVFHGSASGLSGTSDWEAYGPNDQTQTYFGIAAATAGDVNGDGYADVMVGAHHYDGFNGVDAGRVQVYHGSSGGLSGPDGSGEGQSEGAEFGQHLGTAGDVDGDGYSDIIVGADKARTIVLPEAGRAWVFYGSSSGIDWGGGNWLDGDQPNCHMGRSASTAGDVNGDGYADVIVGAPYYDNGENDEGRVYLYYGSVNGIRGAPPAVWESDQASARLGEAAATAGDVNGDGLSDLIFGAPLYDDTLGDEGRAFVYHGATEGLVPGHNWSELGAGQFAHLGFSVSTAGDVNGDGYGDIIAGAPLWDNGSPGQGAAFVYVGSASGLGDAPFWTVYGVEPGEEFGFSVSSAGDVNGDGYSDVVASAPYFDNDLYTEYDYGRAFVFHGSIGGPSATADWTDGGGQWYERFGYSVSDAGDVNGDGYGDLIVGAIGYSNGQSSEGGAFVYYGSASGLSTATDWVAESDRPSASMGVSVASAGDVNGDGYSDVLVGGDQYDLSLDGHEGRAWVYHGSQSGLVPPPAWIATGDMAHGEFGHRVASAGDVNGDGYADVIVGQTRHANPEIDEGRVLVYHGSASGLGSTHAWAYETDQANAFLGASVSTAGDVNGDGYADVIVGADRYDNGDTDEGGAFVFLGSDSGLAPAPHWSGESNRAGVQYGWSAATAGDVNGDGFADIIVGSPIYGDLEEGYLSVYYGADRGGRGLKPEQRRYDNTGLVCDLASSDDTNAFRIGLVGSTPYGRGRVKLRWEVKPLGVPFDGTGTGESTGYFDTGTSGVGVHQSVWELMDGEPHHWRVRLLFDPVTTPFQPAGRWFTVPWNGWQETDLRGNCLFPPATLKPFVTMFKSGGETWIAWGEEPDATSYDVVSGDLAELRGSDGDFTVSADACLADNTVDLSITDNRVPGVGDAFWYLIRGVTCAGVSSYDTNGPRQVGTRDPGIHASGAGCP